MQMFIVMFLHNSYSQDQMFIKLFDSPPAGVAVFVIIISLKFGAELDPLITAVEKIKLLLDRICLFGNLKVFI